jgi:hypothetical protein
MIDWFITLLISAPAFALAARRSSWLLDYAIIVLAFNRGIRRVADYYVDGHFNQFSPISLTPLVVAGLLLVPVGSYFLRLPRKSRTPFYLLGTGIALGFAIGVVLNRAAAVYSLAEWLAGLGAMAFAATQPIGSKVADRWIKTAGWCAVIVAAYGWWQYYTIPAWDGMWLVQSGMAGYMGQPEPTKMTVFSTLNERGPCGSFLAWAVIPMIINPRWRNPGGWLSVAFLLSGIVLTQTRSNLIIIGVVAILYPALTSGRGIGRLLVLTALIMIGATWGLQHVPGMQTLGERFGADSLYGGNSSLQGRLDIYRYGLSSIVSKPLGLGLGCSGLGGRMNNNSGEGVSDSGYVQIFAQFGWLGGLLFFAALWLLWQELGRRWKCGLTLGGPESVDAFVPATRAVLLASLVFLFVGDIFAGFSLLWVFFGRSLSIHADPVLMKKLRELLARRPASYTAERPLQAVPLNSA